MADLTGLRIPPRAYHNCTVVSVSGDLAEVRLPGNDGQVIEVQLQGTADVQVNDVVRVWTSSDNKLAWLDGESPNITGQAAKVSGLYNPGLTSVIASIDANDVFNLGKLFASDDYFNIQQLESAVGATHDFLYTDIASGLGSPDNFAAFYIAVGHKVGGTDDVGIAIGIYIKAFGSVASLTEISQLKASGVTTFSTSTNGNSLRVTTDSDLTVRLTSIAMGGNA